MAQSTAYRGQVAIVTGAARGIGRALATHLAAGGARVVVHALPEDEESVRQLAADLGGTAVTGDISIPADCSTIVNTAVAELGGIDILVNNAAATVRIPHEDLDAATDEIWVSLYRTNVLGAWHLSRLAAPYLGKGENSCIINITSLAGVRPLGSSVPYAVSKAALNHLTLLLAKALGPEIRVNAVAPGFIQTEWSAGWEDLARAAEASTPARRVGSPDEVVQAVAGLLASTYTTGQVMAVDGGMHLR